MRVVAHSCSNTEIVCALGCGDRLVGVDDHSDFPADVVGAIDFLSSPRAGFITGQVLTVAGGM
jgi:NAD(P)-dependent dehydrogenase (short-subunit alcohol dehydrogenase family)